MGFLRGDYIRVHLAYGALMDTFRDRQMSRVYRVIDEDGNVYYSGLRCEYLAGTELHPNTIEGKEHQMDAVSLQQKPLNLKTPEVIAKLEANLKIESDKRAAAAAKEKDARAEFQQFVLDHEEEVVNYLHRHCFGGSWADAVKRATETFEMKDFKTPESTPGRLESDLEKFVRVLKMSSDSTIEVAADQPIFGLL